jgi:hypothetical protein
VNVVLRLELRQTGQKLVKTSEGTALIARDEGCDAPPRARITFVLFGHQSRDRLHPSQQNRTGRRPVAIIQ